MMRLIESNMDAKGRGGYLSNATQNDSIRTRADQGTALKRIFTKNH